MQKIHVTVIGAADEHEHARLVDHVEQSAFKDCPPLRRPCHDKVEVDVTAGGQARLVCGVCGQVLGRVEWTRRNAREFENITFSPPS